MILAVLALCTSSCGRSLKPSQRTKQFDKKNYDALSIPGYINKKNLTHDAKHGASTRIEKTAWLTCKRNFGGKYTDRFILFNEQDNEESGNQHSRPRQLNGNSRTIGVKVGILGGPHPGLNSTQFFLFRDALFACQKFDELQAERMVKWTSRMIDTCEQA